MTTVSESSSNDGEPLLPHPVLVRALRTAGEGMLITDANQAIIFANAAFTALTGYDEAELLGQNCRLLQGPQSDPEVLALMRHCLADGEPFRGQILNYRKDGMPFWNALSISPVHDDDDAVTHFISVQRDMTAHTDGHETLRARHATPSPAQTETHRRRTPNYPQQLLDGGLHMHMQPVVDLRSGETYFVEALARLELRDGAMISPRAFLPLLTESDVTLLFRQALDQVLEQIAEWDLAGLRLAASLNLAPSTLRDPDCAQWVAAALRRHSVEPQRLGIELLESDVLHDTVQVETFSKLGTLGVRLTLDDLGSGQSGLRRLLLLPLDAVKIDGDIVAQIRNRPIPTLRMLAMLIQMGRDHNWDIVIEGLEDAALTEVATILGAPYGQGYFICPPVPAHEIPAWSERHHTRANGDAVATAPGALTYHWMFHRTGRAHPGRENTCPITPILAGEHLKVITWHHQQHEAAFATSLESGASLLEWLTERCLRDDSA